MSYYNTSKGPLLMNFKIIPYIQSNYNELLHMMIKLYKDKIQQQSISLDKIQKIIQTGESKVKITLPTTMDVENFYTGTVPNKKSTCTSPFNQVFLRGNGDIEMCHGYILGNIKTENLQNIWKNTKTLKFQKYIQKHKTIPACFRCCSLNPIF